MLLLIALAAVLIGLGGSARTDGPVFGECPSHIQRARCGTIRVPLDRANPGLGTTRVAFALVQRRDAARASLGTIVPNPGGPGVAAIESSESPYVRTLAPLLDRRDLLLVDPRGTGRSDAISCATLAGPALAFTTGDEALSRIGACGRALGRRAGSYHTAAVTDDIEAVRAALGLERLDLWGDSYGTYLMPVYAARHPEHVQSMVLNAAGGVGSDPWARDNLGAALRGVRLVCARTHACGGDAVLREVARLATRLRRRPVTFAFRAGAQRVRGRIDEAALAQVVWTGGDSSAFGRIPGAVTSALAGDFASLQRLVANQRLALGAILVNRAFSPAQNFATNCHDYPRVFSYADAPAARRDEYERALNAIDPAEFWPFSPQAWVDSGQGGAQCLDWPNDPTAAPPLPAGSRFPDVPVLVLAGDLDANSPSLAGRDVAAQFAHATFVEIPNAGHTPASHSSCAMNLALRFVVTLQANAQACARTGAPPRVAGPAARRAAELPLIPAGATPSQRRALGLVVVTAGDLMEQAGILEAVGVAEGLRGGRYVLQRNGSVRLVRVRVVRDAVVSGVLTPTRTGLAGALRVAGAGVPAGRLRLQLSEAGRCRAVGTLNGRRVDVAFRL
jgi:pimeloyl-ACP methyl ester carboxylesterase